FLERSTGSRVDPLGVRLYARLFGSPGHVEGALGLMADWDLRAVAHALTSLPVPLTIVHGEHDAAIAVREAREVAALTRARLELLPGLGHLAHEERPGEAARIIAEAAGGDR